MSFFIFIPLLAIESTRVWNWQVPCWWDLGRYGQFVKPAVEDGVRENAEEIDTVTGLSIVLCVVPAVNGQPTQFPDVDFILADSEVSPCFLVADLAFAQKVKLFGVSLYE